MIERELTFSTNRLAVVSTHPVQYNVPWLRMLGDNPEVSLRVFYTWEDGSRGIKDPGFGKKIDWDIPLTDGYDWTLCAPSDPDRSRSFRSIDSPTLLPKVREFQPDAALVIGWNFKSHLNLMRNLKGQVPILFRGDSTLLDTRPIWKSAVRKVWLSWVFRHVDLALSVGTNNTTYFLEHGVPEERISVVPHAIDNDRFSDDKAYQTNSIQLRRELGFGEEDVVLLFVGKFEPKKKPDRLLRIFLEAVKHRENLRLLFVGNGVLELQLKKLAANTELVRFLPFQNQQSIPMIYRVGDLTALTSAYNETWGLALNESMACGRPVLVTNKVGAAADLLDQGVTGFLFHDENHAATETLIGLPTRHQLHTMGRHCREFINSKWTLSGVADGVADAALSFNTSNPK